MCDGDLVSIINETYYLSTKLIESGSKNLCVDIFDHLICIAKLLDLKEDEILDACYRKIEKNKMRLASDY